MMWMTHEYPYMAWWIDSDGEFQCEQFQYAREAECYAYDVAREGYEVSVSRTYHTYEPNPEDDALAEPGIDFPATLNLPLLSRDAA